MYRPVYSVHTSDYHNSPIACIVMVAALGASLRNNIIAHTALYSIFPPEMFQLSSKRRFNDNFFLPDDLLCETKISSIGKVNIKEHLHAR